MKSGRVSDLKARVAVAQSLNFAPLKLLPEVSISISKRKPSQERLVSAPKNGDSGSKTVVSKKTKLNKHYAPNEELLTREEIVQMVAMKHASRPRSKIQDTNQTNGDNQPAMYQRAQSNEDLKKFFNNKPVIKSKEAKSALAISPQKKDYGEVEVVTKRLSLVDTVIEQLCVSQHGLSN